MGDFNIHKKTKGIDQEILKEFCNLFSLTVLIKSETCHIKTHKYLINLVFTNKTSPFQTTCVTKTGLCNFLKLITIFVKFHSVHLRS